LLLVTIIAFGENLPEDQLAAAAEQSAQGNLALVLGSTMMVLLALCRHQAGRQDDHLQPPTHALQHVQDRTKKIVLEDCHDTTIIAHGKILTNMMECCSNIKLHIHMPVLTCDNTTNIQINYSDPQYFEMIAWAKVQGAAVTLGEEPVDLSALKRINYAAHHFSHTKRRSALESDPARQMWPHHRVGANLATLGGFQY